jgi:hypothetical protein
MKYFLNNINPVKEILARRATEIVAEACDEKRFPEVLSYKQLYNLYLFIFFNI